MRVVRRIDGPVDVAAQSRAGSGTRWRREGLWLLAMVAIANALAAAWLPEQVDVTHQRLHTLATQTQNLLAHLPGSVKITLLSPREPRSAADKAFAQTVPLFRELVAHYRREQPRIELRELDPLSHDEARRLLQQYPDVTPPCVVVQHDSGEGERHEVLHARDLMAMADAGPNQPPRVRFFGEQALTGALARLAGGRMQTVAYVLTGHGEYSLGNDDPSSRRHLGVLAEHWKRLDIELRPLDLASQRRVPADADLVLLAGGEQPLAPDELEALRRYFKHGGRGLVLCDLHYDPRTGGVIRTGVESLLEEFGVRLGSDRVVMRGVTGRFDSAAPAMPAAGEHPLLGSMPTASVMLYECRSVRPLKGVSASSLRAFPLLVSHPAPLAWADGDLSAEGEPDTEGDQDLPGPVAMAVAVERRRGSQYEPVLAVVGDAELINNHSLSGPNGRSAEGFALACVNWLRGRRELLGDIPPRESDRPRLSGTPQEQRGLVWKSSLFLSALLASAGATVWMRRRVG
ncbi:MAG: Gldg family protein [Planctomycetales bacterium]